jgi:hypothetical protein
MMKKGRENFSVRKPQASQEQKTERKYKKFFHLPESAQRVEQIIFV